jgi:DNA-binding NarL/FixJ family response regulator
VSGAPRVLIADDHSATRAGVRLVLEEGGCEVCAEAATADEAIARALHARPDVCIIDLGMPGGGVHAVAEITTQAPDIRVAVLTVSTEPDDLFDALRAGAMGYLLKDMDPGELPDNVRRLAAGDGVLSGPLTARLIEQFRSRGAGHVVVLDDGERVDLTARENDVLALLADGVPTAEMANRLFLSPVTVRRHVSMLLRKLRVTSRDEARQLANRRRGGRRTDTD